MYQILASVTPALQRQKQNQKETHRSDSLWWWVAVKQESPAPKLGGRKSVNPVSSDLYTHITYSLSYLVTNCLRFRPVT